MSEDLRTRAREVAESLYGPPREDEWMRTTVERGAWAAGWENGYLAHAAQQPTREQVARAIYDADGFHAADTWDTDTQMMRDGYLHRADAVLALLDGAGS